MNIIFLDIDGVLNSKRSAIAYNNYPSCLNNENIKLFDNIAVSLIRKACKVCNAHIVLSSSWRYCFSIDDFIKAFDLPIIDITPRKLTSVRGEEINMWLHAHNINNYCIIDDTSDMLPCQKRHFVHVDSNEGFILKNYYNVLDIFKIKQ